MSKFRTYYEKYWVSKVSPDTFSGYERNEVLPLLFRKGGHVLDVACGDGAVGEYLIKKFDTKVEGLDISPQAVKVAKKRGVNARVFDLDKRLPFKNKTFDVVFWGDNVEHLFKPEFVLKELSRVLKNDGRLILSCPNMGYWRYRLYYLFHGRLPDTEWSGSKPWSWGHIRFFNFRVLRDFLETEGFVIKRTFGISRRKPDYFLKTIFPTLFGMIFVVEALRDQEK